MKRSEMLKLIANQLSFLNGTFNGVKDVFTPAELASADVILTTMEEAGMQPPIPEKYSDIELNNLYSVAILTWEPEDGK